MLKPKVGGLISNYYAGSFRVISTKLATSFHPTISEAAANFVSSTSTLRDEESRRGKQRKFKSDNKSAAKKMNSKRNTNLNIMPLRYIKQVSYQVI